MSSSDPDDGVGAAGQPPRVLGGAVPYLTLSDAGAAAEYYKEALGAVEVDRRPAQDGKRLLHCHLYINGGSVMLSDFFPEYGHPVEKPQAFVIHLQVEDADEYWERASRAGMVVVMPLGRQFWGDRYGQLRDLFGVTWSFGARADEA
jgi:PhnB protein